MDLVISAKIRQKLTEKHGVAEEEIIECFSNREGDFLQDTREDHATDPATNWFIAETNRGRKLKVAFMYYSETKKVVIKTAYEANDSEIRIYQKYA